uniref:Nuclear protein 1, transcriptional regulator n=1 Tax=Equus caballus TaxID=9796 RepID=F7C0N3_HORSE
QGRRRRRRSQSPARAFPPRAPPRPAKGACASPLQSRLSEAGKWGRSGGLRSSAPAILWGSQTTTHPYPPSHGRNRHLTLETAAVRAANPSQQPSDPEDEDLSLDEYDLYGLAHSYQGVGGRKGRTKREAAANTNHPSPGGHERKLVTKLQNTERKKRGARP